MYYTLVACMAGPLDTGQQIATYLLFNTIPLLIYHLAFLILPEDPMLFRFLTKTSTWHFRGHPRGARPKRIKCLKKPKKKLISDMQDKTITQKLPTYLVPALFAAFKAGCFVESNSAVSFAPSSGLHGSWHSKVPFLTIQWSNLTQTHSPSGSTTMHHDAWPMPPTSLRISTSSTTWGR
jgi:hypothetical protein